MEKNKNKILFLIILIPLLLKSQEYKILPQKNNSDCNFPILINDTVFGPVKHPSHYGLKKDFKKHEQYNKYFFTSEHNTLWFKLVSPYNAYLSFDIIPIDIFDDYDFLLFKVNDKNNYCNDIKNDKLLPIRTNIARNDINKKSITGLNNENNLDFVPAGKGNNFSKNLKVNKNDKFILVIDNPHRAGKGYTIFLHWKKIQSNKKENNSKKIINITVLDKDSNEKIKDVKINVSNKYIDTTFYHNDIYLVKKGVNYKITVIAKGYEFFYGEINLINDSNMNKSIFLEKLKKGKKLSIKNIYFKGNSAEILSSSEKSLNMLLSFMQANPEIAIEIEGHVNGPHQPNLARFQKLSEERAKSVKDFLVKNGISKNRISTKGYGNRKMIYPIPKTPAESEANRRVEIKLIRVY